MACSYTDTGADADDAADDTVYDCDGYANDPIKVLLAAAAADTDDLQGEEDDSKALWAADVAEIATAKVTQAEK